jgi:hypothetical protein
MYCPQSNLFFICHEAPREGIAHDKLALLSRILLTLWAAAALQMPQAGQHASEHTSILMLTLPEVFQQHL